MAEEVAMTWPFALVERTEFGVPRKRLVVDAVVEKRLVAVSAEEEAVVKVLCPVTLRVELKTIAPVAVIVPPKYELPPVEKTKFGDGVEVAMPTEPF